MPIERHELKPTPEMILIHFPIPLLTDSAIDDMNAKLQAVFGPLIDIDWRDPQTVEITNHIISVKVGWKQH